MANIYTNVYHTTSWTRLQLGLDERSSIISELIEVGQMLFHIITARANGVLGIAPGLNLLGVDVQPVQLSTIPGKDLFLMSVVCSS